MRRPNASAALVLAGLVLVATAVGSLFLGSHGAGAGEVVRALLAGPGQVQRGSTGEFAALHDVVWQLRAPRALLAMAVGAALAIAGAIAQVWTGNPLADPGILGVNAGAGCAVAAGATVGWAATAAGRTGLALAGAALAAAVVLLVARGAREPMTMVLVGIGVMLCFQAVMNVLSLYTGAALNGVRMWAVGSTSGRGMGDVALAAAGLAAGGVLAAVVARPLDLVAMGEEAAASLGVSAGRVRLLAAVAIVVLAGTATASVGMVLFVGFAAPHVVRWATGPALTRLLPACAVVGAQMALVADVLGRFVMRPGELEMSVVLAIVGAPLMIAVVRRRGPRRNRRRWAGRRRAVAVPALMPLEDAKSRAPEPKAVA
ncbi:hypothetical protein CWC39_01885 [Corynebacterium heidelbergense]|uniref:Iron ABC transporter permease n=2 Tax=Corynebacterium heidelbergense TaxID=2055947 RepID=A0A364VDL4_9CORY|nr:hypothetical protein CWC39_01885 [Corynebacterium heidelbergense]